MNHEFRLLGEGGAEQKISTDNSYFHIKTHQPCPWAKPTFWLFVLYIYIYLLFTKVRANQERGISCLHGWDHIPADTEHRVRGKGAGKGHRPGRAQRETVQTHQEKTEFVTVKQTLNVHSDPRELKRSVSRGLQRGRRVEWCPERARSELDSVGSILGCFYGLEFPEFCCLTCQVEARVRSCWPVWV